LWTLTGIPALVRRLVPRTRAEGTWVVRFLFPGVLLYDSSLTAGGDHIAAVFAAPIFLMLLRAWPDLDVRYCFLLGALLAGSLVPKYRAILLLFVGPALAIAFRGLVLLPRLALHRRRADRHGAPASLGVFAAAILTFSAPHWLKNLFYYRDPFY